MNCTIFVFGFLISVSFNGSLSLIRSVNADAAAIGEQTRPAEQLPAVAGADKKDGDEKVGLALPIAPLVGLGVLNRAIGVRTGKNRPEFNI